jgi:hypothetical protein
MIDENLPIPANVILASNYRLQVAIKAVRIFGRTAQTMGEVYDAIWHRRKVRAMYLASSLERRKALENHLKHEGLARYRFRLTNVTLFNPVTMVNA